MAENTTATSAPWEPGPGSDVNREARLRRVIAEAVTAAAGRPDGEGFLASVVEAIAAEAIAFGQGLAAELAPQRPQEPIGGDVAAAALLAAATAGRDGVLERAASYVPWLLTTAARPREEG